MFNLGRVRVFHEIAECRSVSAAAAALGYTQPSVSHQLAALERELGQRLVNRKTRPMTLTPAGEVLHAASVVALAEFERAELAMGSLVEGSSGHVSLGSVVTGLRTVVPPAVCAFRQRFPDVAVALEEDQRSDLLRRVQRGQLDIGIVSIAHDAAAPDPRTFRSHLLAEQPLMVALATEHRLAQSKHVSLDSLREEQWILPSRARFPVFRAELDRLLADVGSGVSCVLECADDDAVGRLVAAGLAVGFAPGFGAVQLDGVSLVPLHPAVARRLYALVLLGGQSLPVRWLLEALREAAAAMVVSDFAPVTAS
jgi:DNA-binding transcriptional LysR family regulator